MMGNIESMRRKVAEADKIIKNIDALTEMEKYLKIKEQASVELRVSYRGERNLTHDPASMDWSAASEYNNYSKTVTGDLLGLNAGEFHDLITTAVLAKIETRKLELNTKLNELDK